MRACFDDEDLEVGGGSCQPGSGDAGGETTCDRGVIRDMAREITVVRSSHLRRRSGRTQ